MLQSVDGDASRLRPHVKTHKMLPVVQMQLDAGITRFKVATIAEAELCARAGSPDVLLAYQPVGPNVRRLAELVALYPETSFATIVDAAEVADDISAHFEAEPLRTFVDIDVGMQRTGIRPGSSAVALVDLINSLPGTEFAGIHAYDGHIHQPALLAREKAFHEASGMISDFVKLCDPPAVVAGGTPTFTMVAAHTPWQCSPGTALLWDLGYGEAFPDLGFEIAALLVTRVVSRADGGRLCLDLGYKAVAAEKPLERRVWFPALPSASFVVQNEEHLVITAESADGIEVGIEFYAFPNHICPTVALHAQATLIRDGRATGEVWPILARDRVLSV